MFPADFAHEKPSRLSQNTITSFLRGVGDPYSAELSVAAQNLATVKDGNASEYAVGQTEKVLTLIFPGCSLGKIKDSEGNETIGLVPSVILKLVPVAILNRAPQGPVAEKRGNYVKRTEQEKKFILKYVDFIQEQRKVSLDQAITIAQAAHHQFGKVSARSVRDWKARESLVRTAEPLAAPQDEEDIDEEDEAAKQGRPRLVPIELRDKIKESVRFSNTYMPM
jgi:hypothetical protein